MKRCAGVRRPARAQCTHRHPRPKSAALRCASSSLKRARRWWRRMWQAAPRSRWPPQAVRASALIGCGRRWSNGTWTRDSTPWTRCPWPYPATRATEGSIGWLCRRRSSPQRCRMPRRTPDRPLTLTTATPCAQEAGHRPLHSSTRLQILPWHMRGAGTQCSRSQRAMPSRWTLAGARTMMAAVRTVPPVALLVPTVAMAGEAATATTPPAPPGGVAVDPASGPLPRPREAAVATVPFRTRLQRRAEGGRGRGSEVDARRVGCAALLCLTPSRWQVVRARRRYLGAGRAVRQPVVLLRREARRRQTTGICIGRRRRRRHG